MEIAKFQYKGNEYDYKGLCKVKVDQSWIDAVMYCRDGHVYVRELLDFFLNFKCLEAKNPMPGDIYLRKYKTVTDMVQDQLGPGYTPGFGGDKTQIPAYEVECKDPAKDDPNAANEYFQRIVKLKEKKSNNEDSNRAK